MEKLTKQEIKEFEQREAEIDSSTDETLKSNDYRDLALDVTGWGADAELKKLEEKAWARKLLVKAEKFAKDFYDFKELASVISSGDVLAEWVVDKLIFGDDDCNSKVSYEGVSISKNDKDWSRKLYKKAEKLLIDFEDMSLRIDEMINLANSIDELYNYYPVLVKEDVAKDKKWSLNLRVNAVKLFLKDIKVNPEKATLDQAIEAYIKIDARI